MRNALNQFESNIRSARHLGELSTVVQDLTKGVVDVSDILRSELVLSVSALDHLVHELCRVGMIEIAEKKRSATDAYFRFQLPIRATEIALGGTLPSIWMSDAVRERHSWQSFQDPEKLAEALRLISSKKL